MQAAIHSAPVANKTLWAGRIISALPIVFLLIDGVVKLLKPAPVVESFMQLGYPDSLALGIGLLELACITVYLIPRSSALGAILLTGYLGGAVATHVRVGSELFSIVFPIIIGALLWGGLFVRDDRLRALLSPRR